MEPVAEKALDGLLEGLVLHALGQEPSHGYGILKDLEGAIGETPSKNRIYRLLRELEDEGLVESDEVTEESRTKQVYRLTEGGVERLEAYRNLPGPFKAWVGGLFGVGSESPTLETEDVRTTPEVGSGWVREQLEALPVDEPVKAPHARFSLDRAPGEGRWVLTVERHDPGGYEGSQECPLNYVYLSIQRLLYETGP